MAKRFRSQAQIDRNNACRRKNYAATSKEDIAANNKKRASYRHERYVKLQAAKTQNKIDAENAAKRVKRANRTPEQIATDKAKAKVRRSKPENKQHAHDYHIRRWANRTPAQIHQRKLLDNMKWLTMSPERKARRKQKALKWTAANPAKVKAKQVRYRRSIKGALKRLKTNALAKKKIVILTDAEIIALMQQPCHYCGHKKDGELNGLDRLDPMIRQYTRGNCLPCCSVCNISKHTYGYYQFLQYVYDIWLHHFDPTYHALRERHAMNPSYGYFCWNAKRRGIKNELTRHDYFLLVVQDCHYCGAKQAGGVDRCDPAIHYIRHNSVPCCGPCNFMKYTKNYKEFFAWVALVMGHLML